MSKPEDFPIIHGTQQLTKNWSVNLPIVFRRRFENEQLVIWRPMLTIWIDAYGVQDGLDIDQRISRDRAKMSLDARNLVEGRTAHVGALSYELQEKDEAGTEQEALFTVMHGVNAQIMMAAYYEGDEALEMARHISKSLTYIGPTTYQP